MKKSFVVLFLLSFLLYSGCATIFQGSSDTIRLSSEPSEAKILLNGHEVGKTPKTVKLNRGEEYYLEFVKEGYEKMGIKLDYSVGAGWIVLDFLAGLVGLIIDGATGNWNDYDLESYKANLTPLIE